ncbi:hypothetical protein ACFUCQ_05435 [Streptomyces sp. NPDC057197]|uniref:hypothetical protein n=1 Tax=Streptomyces sp. NPDC057197 TaxID=3346045 RepID=UPI0036380555
MNPARVLKSLAAGAALTAADYRSAPVGIYGQPTEQFVAGVTWTYNACHGEWGSGWHDYTNGYNYGDGGAYSYSQGCHD